MTATKLQQVQYPNNEQYELIHSLLAHWADEHDEPIPPFSLADHSQIERLIAAPQRKVGEQELYPTLEDKAAIIFYTICKGQIFQNGNKRMSAISLLVFLAMNDEELNVSPDELTEKALWLANTKSEDFQEVKKHLAAWIKENSS